MPMTTKDDVVDSSQTDSSQSAWNPILQDTGLPHLADVLTSLDVEALIETVSHDRVSGLSMLKKAGVAKLSERQALANALGRQPRLRAAAFASFEPQQRERVPLVCSINVHEFPAFCLKQFEHISEHLPCSHRIVLNCNAHMHAALRPLLPDAFVWDEQTWRSSTRVVCHPQPLDKRRFHGTLLHGIMRNMAFAMRRWDFDAFLVLSSRSWFRRPLTLHEVSEAREQVPSGVQRATLRHRDDDRANRAARATVHWVDVSESPLGMEMAQDDHGKQVMQGFDWRVLLRTRLAGEVLDGQTKLTSPHEGLLLERAACTHALNVLDGPFVNEYGYSFDGVIGEDLYRTEAAVEEFALQSLTLSAGLRFAQLSDFGTLDGLDGIDLVACGAPPLTKTERRAVESK